MSLCNRREGNSMKGFRNGFINNIRYLCLIGVVALGLMALVGSNGGDGGTETQNGEVNTPPVADAGSDQSVQTGSLVTLDGSASTDPDGDTLTYNWTITSRPGGSAVGLSLSNTVNPEFTPDVDGTYVISLVVNDGTVDSDPDTVTVTASANGAGSARGDWWMFGREPTHNRRSPFVGAQTSTVKWEFDTGGVVDSSPAIAADGTVYFGSFDDYVYAVNPDGTLKWKYATGGGLNSSPAIGEDGTVYIGGRDNYVYALNPDGTLKWRYETESDIQHSSPAIGEDGTIYIGSLDGYLYALNPDGTRKWRDNLGWCDSSPAIGTDGTIYVGGDLFLYAINPDGSFEWVYQTDGSVDSSPAIGADGTIYVGGGSKLYAINPDGTLNWQYDAGGSVWSSPGIAADGTIYVGCNDDFLYAINADGSLKWKRENIGDVQSSPSIGADGTIYFSTSYSAWDKGYVYAVNPDSSLKWRHDEDVSVYDDSSAAIASDGTVYIGCGGDLLAF
jgi:outer membrane protein assembly factor BamB